MKKTKVLFYVSVLFLTIAPKASFAKTMVLGTSHDSLIKALNIEASRVIKSILDATHSKDTVEIIEKSSIALSDSKSILCFPFYIKNPQSEIFARAKVCLTFWSDLENKQNVTYCSYDRSQIDDQYKTLTISFYDKETKKLLPPAFVQYGNTDD